MLRSLYNWSIELAQKPYALWALFFYALAEAVFFPLPVELLLIPMIIAAPQRAWVIALVAIAGSVVGAVIGYGVGKFLFEQMARPILEFYHYMEKFDDAAAFYNAWGVWAVMIGGLTPIPFKVITMISGATGFNFIIYMGSAIIARSVRFGIIAWLLFLFGEPIRRFIERYLGWVFAAAIILVILGFVAIGML